MHSESTAIFLAATSLGCCARYFVQPIDRSGNQLLRLLLMAEPPGAERGSGIGAELRTLLVQVAWQSCRSLQQAHLLLQRELFGPVVCGAQSENGSAPATPSASVGYHWPQRSVLLRLFAAWPVRARSDATHRDRAGRRGRERRRSPGFAAPTCWRVPPWSAGAPRPPARPKSVAHRGAGLRRMSTDRSSPGAGPSPRSHQDRRARCAPNDEAAFPAGRWHVLHWSLPQAEPYSVVRARGLAGRALRRHSKCSDRQRAIGRKAIHRELRPDCIHRWLP